jgi:CRISPR-associated protein (TIGR03985 family)
MIWQEPPSVALLQWLARGSLKQNLLQAIRLWVWLHLLYGPKNRRLVLPESFTYAEWRDAFFSESHPKTDEKPTLHNINCPCAKLTATWLFADNGHLTQTTWERSLSHPDRSRWLHQQIQEFEQALRQHGALPQDFKTLLNTRLFDRTGRSLRNDLKILVEIHWLKQDAQRYARVETFPVHPIASPETTEAGARLAVPDLDFFTQPDLAAIADTLAQDLNGSHRFFIHVDYVVPSQHIDRVDEWQAQLRDIWLQIPVPPLKLHYYSVKLQHIWSGIIYPVCIYYYRRGPYLCGFGQFPDANDGSLNWRNYRLDRIHSLTRLNWDDSAIPATLRQYYTHDTLPSPDEIQLRMSEAWGFDYYQPSQLLLLRFEREWNERYIKNSLRHPTFELISYAHVEKLIRQQLQGRQQSKLLKVWRSRSEQDAYYQAHYRQGDPNVWQRLRAWRPHVEVLLPWELRQQFAQEVNQEGQFYDD